MSRLTKITPLFVLMAFVLALVPVSRAQDSNATLGLSSDDYDLLTSAITDTADASSFQLTYSASLSITDSANGNQSLDVSGSGTITRGDTPELAITSSGTSDNLGTLPASFNREIRYVDGVGYNDLIDVESSSDSGWQGQTIDDPFGTTYTLTSILVDPAALSAANLGDLVNLGDAFRTLDLSPSATVTREADTTVKGQKLSHFSAAIDTNGLFESPEFARKLIAILTAQGQDPNIADNQIAAAGILIGSMFRGSAFTVELYVDPENHLTRANADVTLAIDPTKFGTGGSPISAHLTLDFNLSGFDDDYSVDAPADAVMLEATQTPDAAPTSVPATAGETIASGTPVTIDLSGTTDLQYQAANPETITVTAHSLDNVLDTTLEVYDSSGTSLGSNDDAEAAIPGLGPTDSALQNLALPAAGTYTIRVSSFSGGENGQVEVNITASGGQVLSPDLTGKVLFTTEPLKVYLAGQAPVDLTYAVVGQETISIYIKSLESNTIPVDTTLEILDASGKQVAFNDDLNNNSIDPGIENLALNAGVYTIRLSTYDASEIGGVEVSLIKGEVKGIGSTGDNGATLHIGDTVSGTITDTSTDSYTFEGRSGDTITIKAEATNPASPDQDLQLTLYSPDGDLLINDDDSGQSLGLGDRDPAIVSYKLQDDGLYRVEVDSIFDSSGDYNISLSDG
ncbi:MAG: T9SS type A sorting domain-containing protein [Chloroflexota bacterium]